MPKSLSWLLSSALFVAGTPAIAATWVNTATHAIPLIQAAPLGPMNSNATLTITVALKMPDAAALATLVREQNTPGSGLYGTVITPGEFNAQYAPSPAAVARVKAYLTKMGLNNFAVEPNRLFVSANGTVAQVEAAFNTSLSWFSQNGAKVFVNTTPAQVPSALGNDVLSVLGLNNVRYTAQPITPCAVSTPTCVRDYYDPSTYWLAYDVGTVPNARNTSIAVMAEGNVAGVIKDLRIFEKAMSLHAVPVSVEQVGLWSPDTSGQDEWDLDTQYTTGMAGYVDHLYIYATTDLTDQDTALEFNQWVTQDLAKAANASFSICEFFPYLDGTMVADDQVFLEGASQGQTLFSSTGDTGSFCSVGTPNGVPAGAPFVGYPATSTYVVGVGGTTLLTNANGTYNAEVAWYAGGGGISQFEYSPYWQNNVIPTNNTTAGINYRGIPDISMDADPNTGAEIYVNGQLEYVGGTSLSSPLAVGSWARLLNVHPKLGFAPPKLYGGYPTFGTVPNPPSGLTESEDGFNDILTGADGLYQSLPYYDYTTGMGTFDISQKNAVLSAPPPSTFVLNR